MPQAAIRLRDGHPRSMVGSPEGYKVYLPNDLERRKKRVRVWFQVCQTVRADPGRGLEVDGNPMIRDRETNISCSSINGPPASDARLIELASTLGCMEKKYKLLALLDRVSFSVM